MNAFKNDWMAVGRGGWWCVLSLRPEPGAGTFAARTCPMAQRRIMRFRMAQCALALSFVAVLPARAGELDSKTLSLIGPEVKAVYGSDLIRYRRSGLAAVFPVGLPPGAVETADSVIVLAPDVIG